MEKEINIIQYNNKIIKAIALFDKEVGVTIKEKETNRYILCLIYQGSPKWREGMEDYEEATVAVLEYLKKAIEIGTIDSRELVRVWESKSTADIIARVSITEKDCPFS